MACTVPAHRLSLPRLISCLVPVAVTLFGCAPEAAELRSFADGCTLDTASPSRCEDCLRFEHDARLGSADGPGFLEPRGGIEAVVRDHAGNYWVGQGEQINVYGPSGDFLTAVGREGEGPLEFRYARPLHVDASARVHIFDISNMRISVVNDQMALVDEQGLPVAINSIAPIDDGTRYVIQAWLRTPGERSLPLHIVEAGEIVHSFGSVDPEEQPANAYEASATWHLATSPDGDVFLARSADYLIEAWAADGSFLGRIEGLPPLDDGLRGGPGDPYSPENPPWNSLVDVHMDGQGLLWVLLQYRRPDWRDNSMEITYPDGEVAMAPTDMMPTNWVHSRVDVIDLEACAAVASAEHDEFFVGFVADGYLAAGTTTEAGVPHIDIHRVSLEGFPQETGVGR